LRGAAETAAIIAVRALPPSEPERRCVSFFERGVSQYGAVRWQFRLVVQ
jgi:hypothetical protein